jgi:hypothetical protein
MSDAEQTYDEYVEDSVEDQDDESELDSDYEDDDSESEDGESEEEEVEYEGKQYKLPKELKDALLRQQDYTRKTQEVAEMRRTAQAQQAELNEQRMFQEAAVAQAGDLANVNKALEQYANVDWQALSASNPQAAQQHWMNYQQAKEAQQNIMSRLNDMRSMLQGRVEQLRQDAIEAGLTRLRRDIPDFDKVAPKLVEFGVKSLGMDADELRSEMDPARVKSLYKAYMHDKLVSGKGKPGKAPESQAPVPSIKARSGGASRIDLVKDAEKLNADEWAKRRNAQIQAKNARGR